MRLRALAAAAAVAATAAVAAPPATAGPSCAGVPQVPPAYACVVRFAVTDATLPALGTSIVHVPGVCVLLACVPGFDLAVPDATPSTAEVAVLWWNGLCVYVYADGTVTTAPGGPACP